MELRVERMKLALRMIGLICLASFLSNPSTAAQKKEKASATALSPQELFKRLAPSVFVVEALDDSGQPIEQGSAVVIRAQKPASARHAPDPPGWQPLPDGFAADTTSRAFLVTNFHVVKDGIRFIVRRGDETWPAKLIAFVGPQSGPLLLGGRPDVAELEVKGLQAPAIEIRESSTLAVGEQVYAIGAPEGLELTISQGLVSGLRDMDGGSTVQTSAAISPGSSGGGLFDSSGRLIGITTAYLKEGENLNFAIPSEFCERLDSSARYDADFNILLGFVFASRDPRSAQAAAWAAYGIEAFRRAIRIKPREASAWDGLATTYYGLQEYDKAIDAEKEAVRIDPANEEDWELLGRWYWMNLREQNEAIEALQKASTLKPDDESVWAFMGAMYRQLGRYSDVVATERKALALDPSDTGAWFNLGVGYYGLGQRAEVIRVYQKLKTLDEQQAANFFNRFVSPNPR